MSIPTKQCSAEPTYSTEFAALRAHVLKMGGLVSDQVAHALRALLTGNREAADLVIEQLALVRAYQEDIETESFEFLGRASHCASELRRVLLLSRAVVDLARASAEAKKIALLTTAMLSRENSHLSIPVRAQMRQMMATASGTLRSAVAALDQASARAARAVAQQDVAIDQTIKSSLTQIVLVSRDAIEPASAAIDTLVALRSLECIWQHAKHVAEHVAQLLEDTSDFERRSTAGLTPQVEARQ